MKTRLPRYLLGFLVGFVCSAAAFVSLAWMGIGRPVEGLQTNAKIVQSRPLLIRETNGPKLFLVGGSSVGYGISAKTIQDTTGIPTYNYSYWASLGPVYILEQVKQIAKPGDTVLLALEYDLYDWDGNLPYWLDETYIYFVASHDRRFFQSRPFAEKAHFVLRMTDRSIMDLLFRQPHVAPATVKDKGIETWNACGDEIWNTALNRPANADKQIRKPILRLVKGYSGSPKGFPIVKSFLDWATANRVNVLATYPNLAQSPEYAAPAQEAFKKIQDFYETSGVTVIGTPQEAMIPPENCFNTQYHPTCETAVERTQRLLKHLAPELQRSERAGYRANGRTS